MLTSLLAIVLQAAPGAEAPPASITASPEWQELRRLAQGPPPEPPRPLGLVTQPAWIARASPGDVRRAYPKEAARSAISGSATIKCKVTVTGRFEACEVVRQDPEGHGFGEAALSLAPRYRIAPVQRDGAPARSAATVVEGVIAIPIRFNAADLP